MNGPAEIAAWWVFGGQGSRMVAHNLDHGVVTLGWGYCLPDTAIVKNRDALDSLLEERLPEDKGKNKNSRGQIRGNIERFCNDIGIGDLLVLPLKPRLAKSWIAIGEVTGPAQIDDSQSDGDARLHRHVRWFRQEVSRDDLSTDLQDVLTKRRPTVSNLGNVAALELESVRDQESAVLSGDEAGVLPHGDHEVPEGAKKRVEVNKYERDPGARQACIDHHGTTCTVCGLDFEMRYGEIGRRYIHVHHKTPLSQITAPENYKINPIEDLIPVCPNCHAMLHKGESEPFTVEELQLQMHQAAQGNSTD